MIADTTPEPVTLGELLAGVARRAGTRPLVAMTVTGVAGAATIALVLGPAGWLAAAGALAVGAYGAWGLADRELNTLWSRPGASPAAIAFLRLGRALAAIVATLSSLALLALTLLPVFSGLVR